MKWIFLLLALFFASCSDPVSSADLEAQEITFNGTITSVAGQGRYNISAKLNPQSDNLDYVVLSKLDSFFVQVDSIKKKLVFLGNSYSTDFDYEEGQKLEVILYLGTSDQHLVSTVEIPPTINNTFLYVDIQGLGSYTWLPDGSDDFTLDWFIRCENNNTGESGSQSIKQNINEKDSVAHWNLFSFLHQTKWDGDTSCKLDTKATRTIFGDIDYNFASGELIATQEDSRSYLFHSL